MSCGGTTGHGTSRGIPPVDQAVPRGSLRDEEKLRWFKNVKAGDSFEPGGQSLDYALQLQVGIKDFRVAEEAAKAAADSARVKGER